MKQRTVSRASMIEALRTLRGEGMRRESILVQHLAIATHELKVVEATIVSYNYRINKLEYEERLENMVGEDEIDRKTWDTVRGERDPNDME